MDYRDPAQNGAFNLGVQLSFGNPTRLFDVCADGQRCLDQAAVRWKAMRSDADAAYDRCTLTTFPAYEYTNTFKVSNLHRNVVFAGSVVPDLPVTYFEAPTPPELWRQLEDQCRLGLPGCDVVVLPHNSNLSNGQLFHLGGVDAETAALRARMEPVVEVFQHKGDSECSLGFDSPLGEPDELCGFEKLRPPGFSDCGDGTGSGAMAGLGCVSRLDFVRGALAEGLLEEERIGVNPFRLGIIASTDTHNGIPGYASEQAFEGHTGREESSPEARLSSGGLIPGGVLMSGGGLAGVWAAENSREAIFAAAVCMASAARLPVKWSPPTVARSDSLPSSRASWLTTWRSAVVPPPSRPIMKSRSAGRSTSKP